MFTQVPVTGIKNVYQANARILRAVFILKTAHL
jgi:hypothetical protein